MLPYFSESFVLRINYFGQVADLHFKYTGDHTFIYAGVLIG
jgi:hypothetical protein